IPSSTVSRYSRHPPEWNFEKFVREVTAAAKSKLYFPPTRKRYAETREHVLHRFSQIQGPVQQQQEAAKMKRVLILSLLTLGITTLAHAQATRTWVSGVGDDVNPCSRTAPCKTFAGAISKTASPGIINCLDPGGFGAVTITKSIMIDCTGTLGSVLSSGVQGIIVNALTTDKIILRNIDISGAGPPLGTNGVNIIQASSVQLQGVYIETYSGRGVETTNSSNTISLSSTTATSRTSARRA